MSRQQQYVELMHRPAIDEMVARYDNMRADIRNRLNKDFGVSQWQEQAGSENYTGCFREFPDVKYQEVQKKHPASWFSTTPVSPENWAQAKKVVSEVAKEHGFDRTALVIDRADDMQLDLNDQFGAELSFGSAKYTVLTVTTGCHLTAEAKQRGSPAPS